MTNVNEKKPPLVNAPWQAGTEEVPNQRFREVYLDELQTPDIVHVTENDGFIMTPQDPAQLAKLLFHAYDREQPLSFNPNDVVYLKQPVQFSLSKLNAVRNHRVSDLVVTVESGMTMGALRNVLRTHDQTFALNYPDETLLADVLAEDRPSLETGCAGYPRDYVLGLEIVTPQGKLIRAGGEVVKNVTGYDLNKLYVGSHHTLGVISAVTLKCITLVEASRSWCITYDSIESALKAYKKLLSAGLPLAFAEVVDTRRLKGKPEEGDAVAEAWPDWSFFFGIRGPQSMMGESVSLVCELLDLDEIASALHPARAEGYFSTLSTWTPRDLVLEVALPLSGAVPFVEKLMRTFEALDLPLVQFRPAAGLVYLVWRFGQSIPSVQRLRILCGEWLNAFRTPQGYWEGHLHWVQFPPGYLTLAQYCNLPRDAAARSLMKSLKRFADPHGILVASRLPLAPCFGSITEVDPLLEELSEDSPAMGPLS